MLIKTLLNKVEPFKSFVYGSTCLQFVKGSEALVIDIGSRLNSQAAPMRQAAQPQAADIQLV